MRLLLELSSLPACRTPPWHLVFSYAHASLACCRFVNQNSEARSAARHWKAFSTHISGTTSQCLTPSKNTTSGSSKNVQLSCGRVLRPGVDYELAQDGDVQQLVTPVAPPLRSGSMSRSQKRKAVRVLAADMADQ